MERVLLTTAKRIKQNTPVQENVDDDILVPYIYKAQEIHIQQVLGTNLYDRILKDVKTSSISNEYKNLLDKYIIPCLIEWSFYESLPFISMRISNKSVGRGTGDFFSESDLDDLKYLRNASRDMAEFYSERLIGHLKENSNLYKEYTTNSGLDEMRPSSSKYFGGVYLGGGSTDCGWGLGEDHIDLN